MSEGKRKTIGNGEIHAGVRVTAEVGSDEKGKRKSHSDDCKKDKENASFVSAKII